jgi:hypothetical protein
MKNATTAQTQLNKDTFTEVSVSGKRKVTYLFKIVTSDKLNLPYTVAINGKVRDSFKDRPKKIRTSTESIVVENVAPGESVALYLNSDAHPDYRKFLVYAVTPNERDVIVTISEKRGRHNDLDTPIKTDEGQLEDIKKVDKYTAVLTGDIWMRISHAYSSSDVDILLSSETIAVIKNSVKSIYEGLSQPLIKIALPNTQGNAPIKIITLNFSDPTNARNNINSNSDILNDSLKRVHPTAYAAVINAAIDASISNVKITSTWRPMLGSIAHRAGLGLDVNLIDATRLNREELTENAAVNTDNVSEREKELYRSLKDKTSSKIQANHELGKAQAEVRKAKNNPGLMIAAKRTLQEAEQKNIVAEEELKLARIEWAKEKDKNEPDDVRRFRAALMKSSYVTQIYDPWVMDDNVKDTLEASANVQMNKNETIHKDHLHITVYEPKLL